ncbi:MAG: hypothetical protein MRY67_08860 [Rhodovulum sp.]|nr:hypothetical protein [Rhodovulum sp.]
MTPETVEALFTRGDGRYAFARWGRPIVPVVFGVTEESLGVFKGACEAVVAMAGHKMAETDPELGANFMIFFVQSWDELAETPNLDRLVPDLDGVVARLQGSDANQYRFFRFDPDGAIKACLTFLRMDRDMQKQSADVIALGQIVQGIVLWSDQAFAARSPLALTPEGVTVLRPDVADVIRAAYDPVMPVAAEDASHALRLAARLGAV